ncbi:MAG: hypothetical protein A3F54_02040 [Candidatus Kerfeldbacteria bacterium RIFCSPHIGHO2_12_FULL_48_17]|uniref:NIF system FeS cluster assembly NifU N-terminal domain-containing protein n=1 Tax=Candidatus Kerfeldbacteria bacterium RIFCSPHIGHO2_12_FULL_48_17 TaxID=1798542 RepID=A0A1G2AXL5_9BACT|nr:MAG: hypothetical protein A3F54_02040 [Candidatus Kerfeldbacteria bacterium RIFCSPHIGHO2_12_FULL_48_17]
MDNYREEIIEHYKHPQNYGHLSHADATVHERNSSCGDVIDMEVAYEKGAALSAEGASTSTAAGAAKIQNVRFTSDGCSISRASASMLTEEVKGMSRADIAKLGPQDIFDMLGVNIGTTRAKCALLPLDAMKKLIKLPAKHE